MTFQDIIKTLGARALTNPVSFARERVRPSRTTCGSCNRDIPPGKAGRRCAECRDGKTPAQKIVDGVLS